MKKSSVFLILTLFVISMLLTSCSAFDKAMDGLGGDYLAGAPMSPDSAAPDYEDGGAEDGDESDSSNDAPRLPAGMMTAGAWNDNTYYNDWLSLFSQDGSYGKFYKYTDPKASWGYNSLNRVKVYVGNGENPVAGAKVAATDSDGNLLFSAVTDAQGNAYLFPDAESGNITVNYGDATTVSSFTKDERSLSVDVQGFNAKPNVIEIMLVVDVTGSMSDEISFLKAELADVIDRIAANDAETDIRLAMLFYRDTDDDVPFDYYDFTNVTTDAGLQQQQRALDKQSATGGGDYPEAVDDALDIAVNKQWSSGATTKIIFHVLDAPAHDNNRNKQKLEKSVKTAAEKGIRICPIICSGASEDTEYTMREAAIYTGGTFVFITDDSGIGGSHHDPGLPNATVELLNSLMVRLVKGYHTGEFEAPIYWRDDPNLATKG